MLVNMNDVLYPAKKGKYAVGLFNAVNLELARGIIAAAENSQSPVIMGTAEVLLPYGPLEEVSYYPVSYTHLERNRDRNEKAFSEKARRKLVAHSL